MGRMAGDPLIGLRQRDVDTHSLGDINRLSSTASPNDR